MNYFFAMTTLEFRYAQSFWRALFAFSTLLSGGGFPLKFRQKVTIDYIFSVNNNLLTCIVMFVNRPSSDSELIFQIYFITSDILDYRNFMLYSKLYIVLSIIFVAYEFGIIYFSWIFEIFDTSYLWNCTVNSEIILFLIGRHFLCIC